MRGHGYSRLESSPPAILESRPRFESEWLSENWAGSQLQGRQRWDRECSASLCSVVLCSVVHPLLGCMCRNTADSLGGRSAHLNS